MLVQPAEDNEAALAQLVDLLEQVDRRRAVPNRAMGWAIDCLVAKLKQFLDVFVGFVHRPGATDFLIALAAQLEGRFGERRLGTIARSRRNV